MKRKKRKKGKKERFIPGLPPGTMPAHEILTEKASYPVILYNEQEAMRKELNDLSQLQKTSPPETIAWIHIDELNSHKISEIGNYFHLHSLTLEDIMIPNQRPKTNDFKDYLYIVMKMPLYDRTTKELSEHQVSLILGEHYVISIQESKNDIFRTIEDRIMENKGRIRTMKADYLLYSLIDLLVDHFYVAIEELEEELDILEEAITKDYSEASMHQLFRNKQCNITIRKSILATREIIRDLERRDISLISTDILPFLHDVYEHIIQIIESTETFREIISNIRDVSLSSISNKMNQIMQVLTMFASIFIPLTFLAGIYGMNFKYMPELEFPWAYPALIGVMITVTGIMLGYFKRKKWIGKGTPKKAE